MVLASLVLFGVFAIATSLVLLGQSGDHVLTVESRAGVTITRRLMEIYTLSTSFCTVNQGSCFSPCLNALHLLTLCFEMCPSLMNGV